MLNKKLMGCFAMYDTGDVARLLDLQVGQDKT